MLVTLEIWHMYFLEVETFQATPTKEELGAPSGFLLKFPTSIRALFIFCVVELHVEVGVQVVVR